MRHQFKMKEKKLSDLSTELDQMIKDSETISLADTGDSEESRVGNYFLFWMKSEFYHSHRKKS